MELKDLKGTEILDRNQLKNIHGGGQLLTLDGTSAGCSVWYKCNNGSSGFSDNSTLEEASELAAANCGSQGVAYIGGAGC